MAHVIESTQSSSEPGMIGIVVAFDTSVGTVREVFEVDADFTAQEVVDDLTPRAAAWLAEYEAPTGLPGTELDLD